MTETPEHGNNNGKALESTLIDIAADAWRFSRLFEKVLQKLDAGESSKFLSKQRFFLRNLDSKLGSCGIRLINLEGQPYDPGMAATALNADEFSPGDTLVVDQMLEPVVLSDEGVIRTGTVMLRRRGK